jgi:N-acetylmuramoyl-L-alanine amidase
LGLHANKQNFEIAKKENSVIYLEDNYQQRYAEYDINSPESIIGLTIMQEEFLDQSIALAKGIQDNFSNKLKRNDRQVKQAGFIVLHQTFMPSVLVETGFLTNDEEGAYLNSKKGQAEMGKAIADAILIYRGSVMPSMVQSNEPLTPIAAEPKKEMEKPAQQVVTKQEEAAKPVEEVPTSETTAEQQAKMQVVKQENKTQEVLGMPATGDLEGNKATTAKPVVEQPSTSVGNEKKPTNIIFKVQLLASARDMDLRSDNFRGLNRLSRESYKNLYRYMYGNTDSYDEALLLKSNADAKGYPSSYIVAYKDGERIPVPDALKYLSDK